MLPVLFVIIFSHYALSSEFSQNYICPDNAMFYDLQPCNPGGRNQCPENFACRRSRLSRAGTATNQVVHLCCGAINMTIANWFEELELSPQILPELPPSALEYVRIADYDPLHPSPLVHLNDEIQVLDYPNYATATVQAFKFQSEVPPSGGYLHVIVLIDAGKRPNALLINYDLPSEGLPEVEIAEETDESMHHFFGFVSSQTVPQQDTYRQQYVVLVYMTDLPLSNQTNVNGDIMRYIDQISYFLSNSATGRTLGKPIAGLFFYVTSQRTIFRVQPSFKFVPPYVKMQSKSSTIYSYPIFAFLLFKLHTILTIF